MRSFAGLQQPNTFPKRSSQDAGSCPVRACALAFARRCALSPYTQARVMYKEDPVPLDPGHPELVSGCGVPVAITGTIIRGSQRKNKKMCTHVVQISFMT